MKRRGREAQLPLTRREDLLKLGEAIVGQTVEERVSAAKKQAERMVLGADIRARHHLEKENAKLAPLRELRVQLIQFLGISLTPTVSDVVSTFLAVNRSESVLSGMKRRAQAVIDAIDNERGHNG